MKKNLRNRVLRIVLALTMAISMMLGFAQNTNAAEGVTLKVHFSSLDGDDLEDPIVIEDITPGTTLRSAIQEATGKSFWNDLFTKEGYKDSEYRTLEPLNNYASWDDYDDADLSSWTEINEDMNIYVGMFKELDAAEITVTPPICGVETDTPYNDEYEYWKWSEQTSKPEFSAPSGKNYEVDPGNYASYWIEMEDSGTPFIGTFEGGETYKATYWLKANLGYIFVCDDDSDEYTGTVTVNGGTLVEALYDWEFLGIIATVTADHDWNEGTVTKEATCTEPGEKEFECKHNGEEWHSEDASKTEEIDALGHDWGEWTKLDDNQHQRVCGNDATHKEKENHTWSDWTVTKPATETEEGLKERNCEVCDAVETEVIPVIEPESEPESKPAPETSDTTNMMLWFTFLAGAGCILFMGLNYRRKYNH